MTWGWVSVSLPPPWGHPDHPWVLGRVWVQLGVGGHQGRVRYGDTLGTGMQQAWGHPVVHPRRGDTLDAVMGAPRSPVWHPWVQPAGSVTSLCRDPPRDIAGDCHRRCHLRPSPGMWGGSCGCLRAPPRPIPKAGAHPDPPFLGHYQRGHPWGELSGAAGTMYGNIEPSQPREGQKWVLGPGGKEGREHPGVLAGVGASPAVPSSCPEPVPFGDLRRGPKGDGGTKGDPHFHPRCPQANPETLVPNGGVPRVVTWGGKPPSWCLTGVPRAGGGTRGEGIPHRHHPCRPLSSLQRSVPRGGEPLRAPRPPHRRAEPQAPS